MGLSISLPTTSSTGGTGDSPHEGPEIPGFARCHTGELRDDLGGGDTPRIHISPDSASVLTPTDHLEPYGEIRRLLRAPGDGCRYTNDETFGTGGVLQDMDSWRIQVAGDLALLMFGYFGPYDGKEVLPHADAAL